MRKKIYVGIMPGLRREIFKSEFVPTQETHGAQYVAVIGDFRTMRGARYMQKYGGNNPHLQTVSDAERLARLEQTSKA